MIIPYSAHSFGRNYTVGVAQTAERLDVTQEAVGSRPAAYPCEPEM